MECLQAWAMSHPRRGGYLEGREEGLEMYFWILNFLVLGVWIGALGQVTTVRGGGWSGRFRFQLKISTVWLGKGSVSVECAVRAGGPQRHDTSAVRNKDFRTRTHAQNHCVQWHCRAGMALGNVDGSLGVRGAQAEQEAAGLENLDFNSKFPQPWGWRPSRHDTRRVRSSILALRERMHNHCAVACLAVSTQHTLIMLRQRVC